jgi:hypothetical protein
LSTLVLLFALVLATPVQAQPTKYNINGTLPDCTVPACEFEDPNGNSHELGPKNGTTTKIGVINTASLPMLGFNSVAPKSDLNVVYFETATDSNGDLWLYFAWERDNNTGSTVIGIELGEDEPPPACDFSAAGIDQVQPQSAAETNLINTCNPWANRQADDKMLVWDQVGGAITISLRTFDGVQWGAPVSLDPASFKATLTPDNFGGEAVINLTDTILDPDQCTSVGNIIPSTITGNSDSADYMDTVLADIAGFVNIASCGDVIIRKVTVPSPDPDNTDFSFTHDLDLENEPGESDPTGFVLKNGESASFLVFENGVYTVGETVPDGWELTDIDCSATTDSDLIVDTNLTAGTVMFNVAVGETVDCTFTNTAKANLTLTKTVVNACDASDGGQFILTADNQSSSALGNGGSFGPLEFPAGTYGVSEEGSGTNLNNYVTILGGDSACTDGDADPTNGSVTLSGGANVTCAFTNVRKPTVTINKVLTGGSSALFDLKIGIATQAENVGNGGTTGAVLISAPFSATTFKFGPITVNETNSDGSAVDTGSFHTFWTCNNGTKGTGASLNIGSLDAGEDVICTVTNIPIAGDACPQP